MSAKAKAGAAAKAKAEATQAAEERHQTALAKAEADADSIREQFATNTFSKVAAVANAKIMAARLARGAPRCSQGGRRGRSEAMDGGVDDLARFDRSATPHLGCAADAPR